MSAKLDSPIDVEPLHWQRLREANQAQENIPLRKWMTRRERERNRHRLPNFTNRR